MEFEMFLLVLALISIMIATHGEESPTDAYWKMNLGDDVKMPKVVEDALLGTQSNTNDKASHATKVYNDIDVQAYAQQLSQTKSKAKITNGYNKNAAQVYAQQLSQTKSKAKITNGYNKNAAQVYAQQRSESETDLAVKGYHNAAQAYAQQLNEARTNLAAKVYDAVAAQAYAQQLSKTGANLAGEVYHTSAEAYAQRLSRTKSNGRFAVNYKGPPPANVEQILGAKTTVTTKNDRKGSKFLTDNSVLFFFEKDLVQQGTKMKLHFLVGAQKAKFMPKKLANTIPFSSTKLPQILNYFSVDPKSANAKIIEETIGMCESKPIKGESRSCETSLESMIAYIKSHLGNQVKVLSTEIGKETKEEYTIDSAQKIKNEKNMVCHKMVYPYAVFACHTLSKTDAYQVSLIDTHGKTVKAVAVCHKDTSDWNPEHVAFQLLKVKPGGVPICHFLDGDAMIWIPK